MRLLKMLRMDKNDKHRLVCQRPRESVKSLMAILYVGILPSLVRLIFINCICYKRTFVFF